MTERGGNDDVCDDDNDNDDASMLQTMRFASSPIEASFEELEKN